MIKKIFLTGVMAIMLMGVQHAAAFDIPPPPPPLYEGLIVPLFPNGHTVPFSGEAGPGRGSDKPGDENKKHSSARSSTIASGTSQVSDNARELASQLPVSAAQQEQMVGAYTQSFDVYRQLEAKLDVPANDVAGAVAAFIAGNYMAYRDAEVPDPDYKEMVVQIREALATSSQFSALSSAEKRKIYEQMAMIGTFMALGRKSLQQQPNPAAEQNFRDSGAANLKMVLGVTADKVRIGPSGLVIE